MSMASAKKFVADLNELKKANKYDFTGEELKEAILAESDLSADELNNVAGGACYTMGGGDAEGNGCTFWGGGDHCVTMAANCDGFFT